MGKDVAPLPDWNTLATLDDDSLPLLPAALLIARDEYPDLDPRPYDALVQAHADHLRDEVAAIPQQPLKMAAINRHLFDELGYSGNHDEYYDPRNSYLNQVLDRRLGNPISLAMVQMEVARRLDIPLDGVSFPGHFLVRLPVDGGLLVQGRDVSGDDFKDAKVVTKRAPTEAEMADLKFAWLVCKHVKSNAIVLAKGGMVVGVGAGQMSRVDSTHTAVRKAGATLRVPGRGAVLASDAFFPFRDNIDLAAQAGVTAVVQPGGSMRDADSQAACDENGMAMVCTGVRHFRH